MLGAKNVASGLPNKCWVAKNVGITVRDCPTNVG
jgi:hypothetical protein